MISNSRPYKSTQALLQNNCSVDFDTLLHNLMTVKPCHIKAVQAERPLTMRAPIAQLENALRMIKPLDQSLTHQISSRFNRFLKLSDPNLKKQVQELISKRACELSTNYEHEPDNKEFKENFKKSLLEDEKSNISSYAQQNPKKIDKYINRASNFVHEARRDQPDIDKENIEKSINNTVKQIYHRAFLKGEKLPPTFSKDLSHYILEKLNDEYSYALHNQNEIKFIINSEITKGSNEYKNIHKLEGAKFKSNKKHSDAFLPSTQIRTSDGQIFELLNTLNDKQTQELLTQHGIEKSGKVVLGQGGFGKVRLAKDMVTGEIVAVKKISNNIEAARAEIAEFNNIGGGKYLLSMRGHAHISDKSYIFMDLAGDMNGEQAAKQLSDLKKTHPVEAEAKLKLIVQEYLEGVAELHNKGIYHRDIKPANIFHSKKGIRIGDYGFATNNIDSCRNSTRIFLPPEFMSSTYRADKHDIFALGLSIFYLKNGKYAHTINDHHFECFLSISSEKKIKSLSFNRSIYREKIYFQCKGLTNKHRFEGKTLDEVIMKLLERDPAKRISATEALALPYFQH